MEQVKSEFRGGNWLDAGGGHQIFHDEYDGEKELVEQSRIVVVCDYDHDSLRSHISCSNRLRCDLSQIPLRSNSFDLITCGMVVEHLPDPSSSIQELARLLRPGGALLIHTVNLYGYATQIARLSKVIPSRMRRKLIAAITKRNEKDIFPTLYRLNTEKSMRNTLKNSGLKILRIDYLPSGPLFVSVPVVGRMEKFLTTMLMKYKIANQLLNQILVVATKPDLANP